MTLAHIEALEERRVIKIRHARYNAALIVSAIYNANRPSDSEPVSPFAFIPGYEPDPAEEEKAARRRQAKKALAVAMSRLPEGISVQAVRELKDKMIARLKASGFEDAEGLYKEVFADG